MAGGAGSPTTRAHLRAIDEAAGEPDGTLRGWGTEAVGYRIDDFYIGSTDGRGHNQNVQVPVPTNVMGHMASMIQMRTFPAYRSMQDFIRDAIVHRLHQLAAMTDRETATTLNEVVSMEVMASHVEKHARDMDTMRSMVSRADQNLSLAAKEEDWITLRKMLDVYEGGIEDLNEPWRGRLEEILETYRRRLPKG